MNPHTLTADGRCKIALIRRKHIMRLEAAGKNIFVRHVSSVFIHALENSAL
jgi:hypothetical protein